MLTQGKKSTAMLLVVALLASGVAGGTLGGATATEEKPEQSAQDGQQTGPTGQQAGPTGQQTGPGQSATSCAAAPPEDGSDPDADAKGWENGIWYDESIDVNQSDGVEKAESESSRGRWPASRRCGASSSTSRCPCRSSAERSTDDNRRAARPTKHSGSSTT
ncbi:hypothetical protein [Halorussus caseinilyticus]|uniref:hypothetical protein n=1 Tax=Halorussus caseinilyticus TaxID=3034025 RepID=UPI0023E82226|nr:hypothetical protein [Halorussus sp. DT72]